MAMYGRQTARMPSLWLACDPLHPPPLAKQIHRLTTRTCWVCLLPNSPNKSGTHRYCEYSFTGLYHRRAIEVIGFDLNNRRCLNAIDSPTVGIDEYKWLSPWNIIALESLSARANEWFSIWSWLNHVDLIPGWWRQMVGFRLAICKKACLAPTSIETPHLFYRIPTKKTCLVPFVSYPAEFTLL